jgi:hypothetical protein
MLYLYSTSCSCRKKCRRQLSEPSFRSSRPWPGQHCGEEKRTLRGSLLACQDHAKHVEEETGGARQFIIGAQLQDRQGHHIATDPLKLRIPDLLGGIRSERGEGPGRLIAK